MSTASAPALATASNLPRPVAMANGIPSHAQTDVNGHSPHVHDTRPAPAPPAPAPAASTSKKGKTKKMDSSEASKLVAARISQLELDAAGDKEQEAEIEREVKKANRELNTQTSKMDNLQKIDHLTKRCSDLLADMKRHERESIKNKKRADQLQKEKDASRTELSKNISLKEKLEKLCRELQKENNKLKNENKTLSDVKIRNQNAWDEKYSALLQQLDNYQEEKDHPPKEAMEMEIDDLFRQRFKSFIDQYELRELHFHSYMRTKELEVQFNLGRYERERKKAEQEAARSRALNAQVQTFSKTESELRGQLNIYVDKFKQVEDTLNNSNDLFLTFRKEMEDMSKKTKRLEKENENLKRKHEAMNQNILKMAEDRTKHLKDIEDFRKREGKLNGIIKQMQEQGRGIPHNLAGPVENGYAEGEGGAALEGDDSEYDDEYDEDEEDVSEEGDDVYDDETEDELHQHQGQPPSEPQPYGPERPPPPSSDTTNLAATTTNGHY